MPLALAVGSSFCATGSGGAQAQAGPAGPGLATARACAGEVRVNIMQREVRRLHVPLPV